VPEGVAVCAVPYRLGNRYAVPALSDEADFASSGGDFGDASLNGWDGARILRSLQEFSPGLLADERRCTILKMRQLATVSGRK